MYLQVCSGWEVFSKFFWPRISYRCANCWCSSHCIYIIWWVFGGKLYRCCTRFNYVFCTVVSANCSNLFHWWNTRDNNNIRSKSRYISFIQRSIRSRYYFGISLGTRLFWTTSYYCTFHGYLLCKRNDKGTPDWNRLDDLMFAWNFSNSINRDSNL